jgi:hypothetical protein
MEELTTFREWLATQDPITAIVGNRVTSETLIGVDLPALQVTRCGDDSDGDTSVYLQLNGWLYSPPGERGKTRRARAEQLRAKLREANGLVPVEVLESPEVVRDNLLCNPAGCGHGERFRVSIDLKAVNTALVA